MRKSTAHSLIAFSLIASAGIGLGYGTARTAAVDASADITVAACGQHAPAYTVKGLCVASDGSMHAANGTVYTAGSAADPAIARCKNDDYVTKAENTCYSVDANGTPFLLTWSTVADRG